MISRAQSENNSYSCEQPLLTDALTTTHYGVGSHGKSHATFDTNFHHRFTLGWEWDADKGIVAFCMLNPSTADAFNLDPTVRRCFGFASSWGAGGILVVNLFSLRSTDPRGLRTAKEVTLAHNDVAIDMASSVADTFVVGWGNHGKYLSRGEIVLQRLKANGTKAYRLGGLTNEGMPKHPLYISKDEKLVSMW